MAERLTYEELLTRVQALEREIAELTDAGKALREGEERFRILAESAPFGLSVIRPDRKFEYHNPGFTRLFGYTLGDIPDKDAWFQKAYPDERLRRQIADLWYTDTEALLKTGGFMSRSFTVRCKGGEEKRICFRNVPLRGGKTMLTYEDITAQAEAEEALRQSEKKFRALYEECKTLEEVYQALLNSSPDAVVIYDLEGRAKYVCPAFTRIFGWKREEVEGKKIPYMPDSEKDASLAIIKDLIEKGTPCHGFETRRFTKDGDLVHVSISASRYDDHEGSPAGMLAIIRDISERRRLEAQLLQAQKMEAIGTLAGGIAHDFNNILGAVMGYTELTLMELPEGSRLQHNLKEVLKASHRAKDLVRQILAFSRRQEQDKKPIRAHLIIREALKLLRASLPKTIEIQERIIRDDDTVVADPGQIHQILMNLCTNAHHAMAEKGGILEVSLEPEAIDGPDARFPDLPPGAYLRLTVRDTGHGISPQIMDRIFDPYFTTKQKGVGTGLGLAVVHGIAKGHGGTVAVESGVGKGTSFHVLFPRVGIEAGEEMGTTEPLPTGHERILFVDDEEALAEIGREMLERLGYAVVSRTSSVEALEAFKADPQRFDLVITDQTMPNMTGSAFAHELIRIRPDIPIILCTGYSETMTEQKARAMGIREFVLKPVVIHQLARAIRQALGGTS